MGTLVAEPPDRVTRPDGPFARLPESPDGPPEPMTPSMPRSDSCRPALSSDPAERRAREIDWACEWWPPT
jgi:hypothetical protein